MENINAENEIINEFESVAGWMARRGHRGVQGDPLPMGIMPDTLAYIEDHPDEFKESIRLHAYAFANRNVSEDPEEFI